MSTLKRLVPFIILNILISAATTWAVLTWWSNNRAPVSAGGALDPVLAATLPAGAPVANATALPLDVKVIEFSQTGGGGTLAIEMVELRRVGDGELRLNGWRLDDGAGHRFIFPDMVLFKGGSIRVYTRAGSNTATELYWGLKEPVWATGKTAGMYDAQGNLRATFTIP